MTAGTPTSMQEIFDELTGGLRTGDNVVFQTDAETDADLMLAAALQPSPERAPLVYLSFRLPPGEVHRRFAADWDPDRFLLVDCSEVAPDVAPPGHGVRVTRLEDASPQAVRSTLHDVTQELGAGTTYVFDGLTGMQERWSADEALSLFLWACPKLYEERTVAYWTLRRSEHTSAFLAKLAQVTQVVVDLGRDGDRRWAELRKAHGRDEGLVDGRIEYVADEDGVRLLDRTPANRQRVGRLVKQQRLAAGLSQAELARRVGVSPSALSQAERGQHGVSGDVLVRVWEALGVPFGDLQAGRPTHRVYPRSGRHIEELQQGLTCETVVESPEMAVHILLWEPGASGHKPPFATKRREFVLVLEGVLQLGIGRSDETLQQGDAIMIHEPVRSWRNPADVPARAAWSLLP